MEEKILETEKWYKVYLVIVFSICLIVTLWKVTVFTKVEDANGSTHILNGYLHLSGEEWVSDFDTSENVKPHGKNLSITQDITYEKLKWIGTAALVITAFSTICMLEPCSKQRVSSCKNAVNIFDRRWYLGYGALILLSLAVLLPFDTSHILINHTIPVDRIDISNDDYFIVIDNVVISKEKFLEVNQTFSEIKIEHASPYALVKWFIIVFSSVSIIVITMDLPIICALIERKSKLRRGEI